MKRRLFIHQASLATAGMALINYSQASGAQQFPTVRTPESQRKFKSAAIEETIRTLKSSVANKELGWLFENCFPNTLDTTVDFEMINGKPDTYVITGDIDAMWLRDSSAQVWPYLPLMKSDKNLQQLIAGVINRQTKCILKDPYANAFYKDENKVSEWKESDITSMKAGIHERKWEIDSLCYPIRLAHGYWKTTGDTTFFDKDWIAAMHLVIQTFKEQQRLEGKGPYTFQRKTAWATDGVPLGGYGYPTKKVGLIHSMFRPSDDATVFPFLIPSNFFAYESLLHLQELAKVLHDDSLGNDAFALAGTIKIALDKYGKISSPSFGEMYAYEVNGFGSYNLMDDANIPSLLSLPYLAAVKATNPVYQSTRKFLLSDSNPFFFKGKAGEGIGGPHIGMDYIWPMSITMRGLTSINDAEIKSCLTMLVNSHGGTGFMHESFFKDDAKKFTRKWFAWANTLFGEFVLKLYHEKPQLLK
ncbi:MAG: glycoside hydrolase family 125 protein [Chitinophagaceae bacterium]